MNLSSIDLNLLLAFNALAREGNVTLAAQRLGLSQPAMSNALARLRRLFNDQLFVRTSRGMQPTPLAAQLADPITRACDLLESALRAEAGFDPARSSRKTFTLYLSEVGELVFLPRVLHALQQEAPRLSVRVSRVPEKGAHEAMAAGEVDLAIGLFPGLKAGFYQQRLYGDRFVCIVREGHPLVGDSLSLEQYAALPHAVVVSTGTGHDTAVEQSLVKQRVHRPIAVAVPHFLVLPAIVAETDAIATVPFRMAAAMQGQARIRVLEAPLSFPRIEVRHYWHERYHKDAASTWLRALVARLLKE